MFEYTGESPVEMMMQIFRERNDSAFFILFCYFGSMLFYLAYVYFQNNYGSHKNFKKKKYAYSMAFMGPFVVCFFFLELLGSICMYYLGPLISNKDFSIYMVEKYPDEEELEEHLRNNPLILIKEGLKSLKK